MHPVWRQRRIVLRLRNYQNEAAPAQALITLNKSLKNTEQSHELYKKDNPVSTQKKFF
jgi:hypothetical protein